MEEYYVYIYLDPTLKGDYKYESLEFDEEPFYVGKGSNYRAFRHMYNALKSNRKRDEQLSIRIREMFSKNIIPTIRILHWNCSEVVAYSIEAEMVSQIGRISDMTGPLLNLNGGGGGNDSTNNIRPVRIFDVNGKWLKDIRSLSQASIELNIRVENISRLCSRARYSSKIPFQFRYVDSGITELPPTPKRVSRKAKGVLRLDRFGNELEEFRSCHEAVERNPIKKWLACGIRACCTGKNKSHKGTFWKYKV